MPVEKIRMPMEFLVLADHYPAVVSILPRTPRPHTHPQVGHILACDDEGNPATGTQPEPGASVEALLSLIESRLSPPPVESRSCRWVIWRPFGWWAGVTRYRVILKPFGFLRQGVSSTDHVQRRSILPCKSLVESLRAFSLAKNVSEAVAPLKHLLCQCRLELEKQFRAYVPDISAVEFVYDRRDEISFFLAQFS